MCTIANYMNVHHSSKEMNKYIAKAIGLLKDRKLANPYCSLVWFPCAVSIVIESS